MQTHPYQYALTNDFQASRHLTVFFYSLFAILTNFNPSYLVTLFLSAMPVFYCFIFYIVRILNEKRRSSFIRINNQLDAIENLTYDAIRLCLSSLHSETQIRMVIKYGFSNGSRTVISSPFVKYIIENYPDSNWIATFIIFLYASIWGTDQMTYKFFLHFLSIGKFGFLPNFLLFQNVYCYMQCSETISPIIKRYLNDYRKNFIIIAQEHKYFWSHASSINSLSNFQKIIQNFALHFSSTHKYLLDLKAMFPYNPSVLYEMAIFEADFKHNIRQSSYYFNKAYEFSSNSIKAISGKLFSGFEIISSTNKRKSFVDEKEPIEYSFLSILENHERAQRNAVFFNTNDKYIKRLSNTFTAKADSLPQYTTFIQFELYSLITLVLLMIVGFFGLLYIYFHMTNVIQNENSHYSYIQEMIEHTLLFRRDLSLSALDVLLIWSIQNRTYENLTKDFLRENEQTPHLLSDKYFWLAVQHLNVSGEETSKYTYYYYDLISKINIPNEDSNNSIYSRFDTHFYDYHRTVFMFIQSRSITDNLFKPSEFANTILALDEIAQETYLFLDHHIKEYANKNLIAKKKLLIILPITDVFVAAILGASLYIMIQNYFLKIYRIISTIQPPALKVISEQFDRLLKLQFYQTKRHKHPKYYNSILYYVIGLLIQIVLPFIFYAAALKEKNAAENSQIYIEKIPSANNDTTLIYYTYAMVECLLQTNSTFIPTFNETMLDELFGSNPFCVHNLIRPLKLTDSSFNCNLLISVSFIIMIISFAVFIFFILSICLDVDCLKSTRNLFYFISGPSQQTNPVLSLLYNGQQISTEEVNSFSKDLKMQPTNFEFFASMVLDQDDNIVSRIGNFPKLLNNRDAYAIRNLRDLKNFLSDYSITHEKIPLAEFFEKRVLNKPFFFTISGCSELSIQFISPNELFFKDEACNSEFSQKRIRMQKLAEYSEKLVQSNIDTKLVILMIIEKIQTDSQMQIILSNATKYEHSGLMKIDTRNNRVIFIMNILNNDKIQASKIIFNFLNDCSEILPEIVCAVDFGGPISLLNTTKSPMARSRVIGSLFDVLSIFASSVKVGTIYLMKPFLEISNFDKFPRTNDNDIAIELNTYKVTDKIFVQAAHFSSDLIKFMI